MSSISSGLSLNDASVRPIELSQCAIRPVSDLPEDLFQQVMEGSRVVLEERYLQVPETASNPTYASYAQVTVNGKIVAEIDNHGWVQSSNALSGKIQSALEGAENDAGVQTGPLLAQARAERLAEQLGGKIVRATTALTQSQFDAIPQPKVTVDEVAMRQDPLYEQMQKTQQAHLAFLAQQIAQGALPQEAQG